MSNYKKYDDDFKKTLVELYNNGRTQSSIANEYGISLSALARWIRLYSTVKTDTGEILTAKQIKDLQKRNAQLEEENIILKKRLPSSRHTQTKTRRGLQTSFSTQNQNSLPASFMLTEALTTSILAPILLLAPMLISKLSKIFCKFILITIIRLVPTKFVVF